MEGKGLSSGVRKVYHLLTKPPPPNNKRKAAAAAGKQSITHYFAPKG